MDRQRETRSGGGGEGGKLQYYQRGTGNESVAWPGVAGRDEGKARWRGTQKALLDSGQTSGA